MPFHRYLHLSRTTAVVSIVAASLLASGCSNGETTREPSTCPRLQAQLTQCSNIRLMSEEAFGPFCAAQAASPTVSVDAGVKEDCLSCLDGHLCSLTTSCAQCGLTPDAGAATTGPTCQVLQTQLDTCTTVPASAKKWFGAFCAAATNDCRACIDGRLCGETAGCDSLCALGTDGGR